MFKLILKKNGVAFQTETFKTHEEADKYLAEEQSQIYWKGNLTAEIVDITPTKEQSDAKTTEIADYKSNRASAIVKMADAAKLTEAERLSYFGE